MKEKIWLLFSCFNGWDETKHFHKIFWEEPTVETLSEYLSYKTKNQIGEELRGKYENVLKGNQTWVYGEYYWVEVFEEPENKANEKDSITDTDDFIAKNLVRTAEGL